LQDTSMMTMRGFKASSRLRKTAVNISSGLFSTTAGG
jgi:hypothetical protein